MPGMNTMAENMLKGMYAPKPGGFQSSTGGGGPQPPGLNGSFAPQRPAPWNNWGAGDQPPEMTETMFRLQQQCLAGDGRACNQLKVAQGMQQQSMMDWNQNANQQGQRFSSLSGGGPMRAR